MQSILQGLWASETSSGADKIPELCRCHQIWDPSRARFARCFLPVVAASPTVITAGVILYYSLTLCLRRLPLRRPRWTKAFVDEQIEETENLEFQARNYPWRYTFILILVSLLGCAAEGAALFYAPSQLQATCATASWAAACVIVVIMQPKTSPISLLILYSSIFISHAIMLVELRPVLIPQDIPALVGIALAIIAVITILCMPLRNPRLPNTMISPVFSPPKSQLRSPEDNLSLVQFLTVSWMSPLMSICATRQLHDEDVWSLSYQFQHRVLHDTFRKLQGSVLKRLLVANGMDLVIISLLGLLELFGNSSAPVLLQQILKSMEDSSAPRSAAVTYATLSLIVRLIAAQSAVLNLWFSRRSYERSRGELITMLSQKTMTRKVAVETKHPQKDQNPSIDGAEDQKVDHNPDAEEPASTGKVLNLIRFDAYEVAQRFWEFQNLVTQPLGVVVYVILIWRLIGWPCLIGVLTVFLAQAINALVARSLLRWEKIRRLATDDKLQKISQFVEAIRHLRWYGWQDVWLVKIMEARQKEMTLRVITSLFNIVIGFINNLASGLFPVVAFYAYTVLAGEPLRIDVAFPALQLFAMLENSLREIPGLITVLLNASVALGRIENFMMEPDKEDPGPKVGCHVPSNSNPGLILNQASFAWPGSADLVLHNISLDLSPGLTMIMGEVGSGKTALLQALLGELDQRGGEYSRPSQMVGYCAQTPWLQSMSIRENILFSSPYEESRYNAVLDACALTTDMANFKHGDLSNIGENGIGLSGGQKARVALARAVYSRAMVLLLDDPLSALDAQTAETIVRKLLSGGRLLRDRTTVLVTHRTELLHGVATQVIEVVGGRARKLDSDALSHGLTRILSPDVANDSIRGENQDQKPDTSPEKAFEDEHRAQGGVKALVYWEYLKAGTIRLWMLLVLVLAFDRLVNIGQSWFLKSWGEAYNKNSIDVVSLLAPWGKVSLLGAQRAPLILAISDPLANLPAPDVNIRPWLIGFLLIASAQSFAFLLACGALLVIVYTAARKMFADVMSRVAHATFRFYDVTPVGRLLNRLTGDCSTIDGNISGQFQVVATHSISWVASIIVIMSVTPVFLIFAITLTAAFILIFLRFLPTSQSLRRLEMVSLSPLMSNFGAVLSGLTTIRAFRAEEHFQDRVIAVTDTFQKHDHFYWCVQAWLMYRFDALSACSTLILTLLALYTGVSPGLTAFVLTAAARFVSSTHALCKTYGELQMDFVSVERVVELLHLDQEPPGSISPPAWWPSLTGDIVFENVTLRYAPHLEPSLSEISLRIKAGSNTALLGRTGSGKSTLALALLATVLPETGRITIDNIDISKVDTQALRRRITFLAQEPVLFPGSMRLNLDPLGEYSDEACQAVLVKIAGKHHWTLETQVETGGRNISQGQRQLVGLARALLRRSPIVIFDEATASIDTKTAIQIQKILREEMKESTVITIAHRLEAVKNADYCVVLGKGKVLEQGRAVEML